MRSRSFIRILTKGLCFVSSTTPFLCVCVCGGGGGGGGGDTIL